MSWNGIHAIRGNTQPDIHNAMGEMAYAMQYGLIPTLESLSQTHIGGHQMKTRHLEMRARMHANRGPTIKHRNATLMRHGKDMEYGMQTCKNQWQNEGQNSPETR